VPHVLGLTGSIVSSIANLSEPNDFEVKVRDLEALLDSQVITAENVQDALL